MPAPVSKKQQRYMHAIMSGKPGSSSRGDRVPKGVAEKYSDNAGKDAPESKGKEHEGGKWGDEHHKRHEAKQKEKKLKKSKSNAAGVMVVDDQGRVLVGRRDDDGLWANPGGKVDAGESYREAAIRELKEETGLTGRNPEELMSGTYNDHDAKTFLVTSYDGQLKPNGELTDLKFVHAHELPVSEIRDYTKDALKALVSQRLKKSNSLQDMFFLEELEKNIIRGGQGGPVHEVTHGDALRLVGNGTFRWLKDHLKDMGDEDFKDIPVDTYTLHVRKHANDVYSGRIVDGHKQIHQFQNRSLPAMAAELMSIFEWYMPEDEPELDKLLDHDMPDEDIHGGLNNLMDNYKKHNLANIYTEMENIREEIRHGNAVDLQQVEAKIMKLFDKLETALHHVADKHNKLTSEAGKEIDDLQNKLLELQSKIDSMGKKPTTLEAFSTNPKNHAAVHRDSYPYLSRPSVEISPDGRIRITFSDDWMSMDMDNFLTDMRAKVVKKTKRDD